MERYPSALPFGGNLKKAVQRLREYEKKNDAEHDFDEAKTRHMAFSTWADKCKSAFKSRDHSLLPHLKEFFGSTELRNIGDTDLTDYRAARQAEKVSKRGKETGKTTSPTTVNKELALLKKLLRLAHNKELIRRVPQFKMEPEPSRDRTLKDYEFNRLLENSPTWLQRVMICATETALSRGDLLSLDWAEVDQVKWLIQLKGGREKTEVRQEIPIRTARLTALFNELDAEYKSTNPENVVSTIKGKKINTKGLVFTIKGKKITPMQIRWALQKACRAAKITDFTLHDFRHCAITMWHTMHVPVSAAMRAAGHSSVASHKKYVNMDMDGVIDAFTICEQRKSEPTRKPASA